MKDKIPHRSALRSHIQLRWRELLDQLQKELQVCHFPEHCLPIDANSATFCVAFSRKDIHYD